MTTAQQAARMQQAANQIPTSRLVETIRFIGGDVLPCADNMARAALLKAYRHRKGVAAMDELMDEIGL